MRRCVCEFVSREMDEGANRSPKSGKKVSGNLTPHSGTETDLLSLCRPACPAATFCTAEMDVKTTAKQKLVLTLLLLRFKCILS